MLHTEIPMHYDVGAATDIGRKRSKNQDSIIAVPDLGLFVVADGMGGHRGGETASAMVVQAVPARVKQILKAANGQDWSPRDVLIDAVQTANSEIYKKATDEPALQGMGTTTVSMLFKNDSVTLGHVGDSRCYYFSPSGCWQATRDHSLVQERMRAGLITREQAKTDRMKNVITRSVGFEPAVDVEVYEMKTKPGDTYLLCSDGLSGMLNDHQIFDIVKKYAIQKNDPQRAVDELIFQANNNGGEDNISVIIVRVK